MELHKTEYSESKGIGKLDKVLLNCIDHNYYNLIEYLYKSQNEQSVIIKALYDNKLKIVLKFGYKKNSDNEYNIGKELLDLPNFIRFFCLIECNDDIKNIINQEGNIMNYKMCHYGEEKIAIIVMKYYKLGSLDNYNWNKENFIILKNIIKQVLFAIIYAYQSKGFIHNDLHTGNILLKNNKKKDDILYGDKILKIYELEAVIMDFERAKINDFDNKILLLKSIDKFIMSINGLRLKNDIFINININKIKKIFKNNENYYDGIDKIIDNIQYREYDL